MPTGPLRWTVITVATGIAIGALVLEPVTIPRAITCTWGALIGVLLIATIHAVDPLHAWIGTPDRRMGLLTWLTFPALFLAGHACTTRDATRPIIRASTIGAMVLGAWSAAELLGHPVLGLEFADGRAGGPFGQPAYLGAACVLIGPLALATAMDRPSPSGWRRAGALGTAGALLALGASQTRAAWIGAAVALVALAVQRRARLRPHLIPIIVITTAVVVIALITPLGARAGSTFDLSHGTTAGRFDEWRIASHAIAEHPLLGVGPEGYRVVFPQVVDAAYIRKYGVAVFPDRAHNAILDVTLSGGLLAGLLYAALLVLALFHAWRALGTSEPLDTALGVAVIAYVVQQQFLFPLAELDPIFWVVVGVLVARTPSAGPLATLRARWLVVPVAIATAFALTYGTRDVLADHELRRATRATDELGILEHTSRATRLRPDSIRTWYVAARVMQPGNRLTDLDIALDDVLHGLDRSPRDPALRVLYGELLVERGARSELPDDARTARQELERMVKDAPHDPRLRNDLVTVRSWPETKKP